MPPRFWRPPRNAHLEADARRRLDHAAGAGGGAGGEGAVEQRLCARERSSRCSGETPSRCSRDAAEIQTRCGRDAAEMRPRCGRDRLLREAELEREARARGQRRRRRLALRGDAAGAVRRRQRRDRRTASVDDDAAGIGRRPVLRDASRVAGQSPLQQVAVAAPRVPRCRRRRRRRRLLLAAAAQRAGLVQIEQRHLQTRARSLPARDRAVALPHQQPVLQPARAGLSLGPRPSPLPPPSSPPPPPERAAAPRRRPLPPPRASTV
jgi:hypothetical protein